MPTGYVKKLAKKHKMSVGAAEKKWDRAKAAAKKEGHEEDYDYITGVFKNMMGESGAAPTFMQFLILENEMETALANDVADEYGMGGEEDFEDFELDLDTDERFLSLPRHERVRLKKLSREVTGYELEDELEQAFLQSIEGKPYFTTDDGGDEEPPAPPPPPRDPNAPRQRRKSGATHAYKIRRLGEPQ
jgi:hypothetical protein